MAFSPSTPIRRTARGLALVLCLSAVRAHAQATAPPRLTLAPRLDTIPVGSTRTLSVTATAEDGKKVPPPAVTWTSSDPAIATISPTGAVHALKLGTVTITGIAGGQTLHTSITVYGWARLTAGEKMTCGVTTLGQVYCWGTGGFGELGTGTKGNSPLPRPVAGHFSIGTQAGALSTGGFSISHVCAITPAGKAMCWGWNSEGQLGDGTKTDAAAPVPVAGDVSFVAIGAALAHTCGIGTDGAAYCWGASPYGLGLGNSVGRAAAPQKVSGGPARFTTIAAGYAHTCALDSDAAAWCWGDDNAGDLGTASQDPSAVPVRVKGAGPFAVISTGYTYTCGVTTDGAAWCWGNNTHGEIGDGSNDNRTAPVRIGGTRTFFAIATGAGHTCALAADSLAYCWGRNEGGELGNGTNTPSIQPVAVTGRILLASITAGATHSCGVASTGRAYCWGANDQGQLGSPGGNASSPREVQVPGQRGGRK